MDRDRDLYFDLDVLVVRGSDCVDADLEDELDEGESACTGDVHSSAWRLRQASPRRLFPDEVESPQPEGEKEPEFVYFSEEDRLIKDRDPGFAGFPGFCGCHWSNGRIYPFGSPKRKDGVPAGQSPTGTMVEQAYVGVENMASTYRLLCKFELGAQTVTRTGSAIALSAHKLVTAGHNLQYVVNNVTWNLKEVFVLAGEYVPVKKLSSFGYKCKVLSQECDWGSRRDTPTVCPATGADIGFLSVESALPCWLLPCSPSVGLLLSNFGFPGASDFLRIAIRELKDETTTVGPVWYKYKEVMRGEIEEMAANCGDFRAAELAARKLLSSYFQVALRGMPDGVQACSAGQVEQLTDAVMFHACPSLPGSSGGAVCSLQQPGYVAGCHAGGLPPNMNLATSVDNPKFVDAYMRYVIRELPPPSSLIWSRRFFNIAPFLEWIDRHKDKLPLECYSWLQSAQAQTKFAEAERPSKRSRSTTPPLSAVVMEDFELETIPGNVGAAEMFQVRVASTILLYRCTQMQLKSLLLT